MTKDNTYREKGRAVFLAAIMIVSIVAMSTAFTGAAAAANVGEVEQGPVEFEDNGHFVEIVFDDDVSDLEGDNVTVTDRDGSDVTIDDNQIHIGADANAELDNADGIDSDQTLIIDVGVDLSPGATLEIDDDEYDIETTSTTVTDTNDEESVWLGENVAIIGENDNGGEYVQIDGVGERGLGDNSVVRTLDTSQYDDGEEVNITYESGNTFTLNVEDLGLEAWSDSDSYTYTEGVEDNASVEITGSTDVISGVGALDIFVYDDEGDEVDNVTGETLDSEAEVSATFDLEEGDYTAEVVQVSSGISAETDEFSVSEVEPVDADVWFVDDVSQEQGDVLEFDLGFENADELDDAFITISDDDYHLDLELDLSDFDGDEATIEWNTYNAGNSSNVDNDTVVASATDDLEVNIQSEFQIGEGNQLATGSYSGALYMEDERENRISSMSLIIDERSTGDIETGIAPQGELDDESSVSEIADATTDSSDVAEGDQLVFEVEVSGIYGYGFDNGDFADDSGIDLIFTDTHVPSYTDADSFNASHSSVDVIADADNNTVYAVVDTEGHDYIEEDEEWDVEFVISDENPYVDEDEDETAETGFSVLERMAVVDVVEEPYQVTPDEDAEVRGVTTLAPGSELNVELDKQGVFLADDDVEVYLNDDGDRVFVYAEDYSDRSVGEEFDIEVDGDGVSDEVDGIFAEIPEWETVEDSEALQQEIDELNEQLNDIREALGLEDDADLEEILGAIDELGDTEELQNQLDAANDTIADLQDKKDNLEADNADLQGQLDDANDEIADLQDKKDDLESQIDQLEADNADLQDEIDGLESDNAGLQDEIDQLESDLADAESSDNGENGDDDGQPGFGVAVAFVALLGAAMLALRRQN